jgi:drebrin-like protein
LKQNLNSGRVMYGLLKTTEKYDASITVKFVFIYFVGDAVPFAKRGRYGVVKGDVVKYFQPYHIDYEISDPKEINEQLIKVKISETTGTAMKAHESDFALGKAQRGFTQSSSSLTGSTNSLNQKGPQVATQVKESVSLKQNAIDAIKSLRNDKGNTNWVLTTYSAFPQKNQPAEVELLRSGNGTDSEWKPLLKEDKIIYGLFRLTDVIDQSATVKFVSVQFIGKNVPPTVKAKVSTLHAAVKTQIGASHADIICSEAREVSDAIFLSKVQSKR